MLKDKKIGYELYALFIIHTQKHTKFDQNRIEMDEIIDGSASNPRGHLGLNFYKTNFVIAL